VSRLVDAGQPNGGQPGDRGVVVTNQRQVLRDTDPQLEGRFEDAEGGDVGAGEDRGRPLGTGQQVVPVWCGGVPPR
jgi:hypothetical protein